MCECSLVSPEKIAEQQIFSCFPRYSPEIAEQQILLGRSNVPALNEGLEGRQRSGAERGFYIAKVTIASLFNNLHRCTDVPGVDALILLRWYLRRYVPRRDPPRHDVDQSEAAGRSHCLHGTLRSEIFEIVRVVTCCVGILTSLLCWDSCGQCVHFPQVELKSIARKGALQKGETQVRADLDEEDGMDEVGNQRGDANAVLPVHLRIFLVVRRCMS